MGGIVFLEQDIIHNISLVHLDVRILLLISQENLIVFVIFFSFFPLKNTYFPGSPALKEG